MEMMMAAWMVEAMVELKALMMVAVRDVTMVAM
jgi:hypothetical protein